MKNLHYAAHQAEHDRFSSEVTGVVASCEVDGLARQVQAWIVRHITTLDRQLMVRGE
ncbi:MAG: hypothetical protein OEN20_05945 [Gammaproteobacteria bacterium]|nr:hypothetical protein [Gammaproteobacteria bacterium]